MKVPPEWSQYGPNTRAILVATYYAAIANMYRRHGAYPLLGAKRKDFWATLNNAEIALKEKIRTAISDHSNGDWFWEGDLFMIGYAYDKKTEGDVFDHWNVVFRKYAKYITGIAFFLLFIRFLVCPKMKVDPGKDQDDVSRYAMSYAAGISLRDYPPNKIDNQI